MNAAAQRRLTPWLVGAVALLGALLLALLGGIGRGVRWDAPRPPAPLPPLHRAAPPPVTPPEHYAEVWQHPLFSSDRKPMDDAGGGDARVSLGELELTGIILTPNLHMALLRDKSVGDDKKPGAEVRVREGESLPDGRWKLVELQPRSVTFASAGGRTVLKLPAGAPIDAAPTAAPPARPSPGAVQPRTAAGARPLPAGGLRTGQPPVAPPPQGAQLQRMLRLKEAILKQRARQQRADDGDH
ncbi:general secretion pathway protein GspN [Fulvimonas sp. R45]|jgi:general secretion pathway protein N|uniref:general secretion pathway protein GspN n=1 Tax=Fulvimonas sp. R45 TaxID=3045937 RepID=UPI00265E7CBD|nr:general secretion pathway protein GspN [Fulvimonas sp. R45]MDO1528950.1 general secretion pathway protein GspN [Fulvimonas sp. R45]